MRFIHIVCFVFLFYSCVKKSKLNEDSINIEMPVNNQDSFNLSQYVDSVAYVKLQTLDDLVINRISRIKIFDNRIYIHDSKLKSLFVFDSKGLFLYSIRDVGGVYRDWETDRKSTRLNSSHRSLSRMPSSA